MNRRQPAAGMPRWVKATIWLGVAVMLALLVALAAGHGPGQHMGWH